MSKFRDGFVNTVLRMATGIIFRVDDHEMEKLPLTGPYIVVANHINAMEAPVVLPRTWPRRIKTVAKVESWDSALKTYLFKVWGGIPVDRGEADLEAIRASLKALEDDRVLIILPEGTRSYDGQLLEGQPGVSMIAVRSKSLIIPVVYYGGEDYKVNLKKLKRTDFTIKVGNPFYVKTQSKRITKKDRKQIVDEMMYQMASLLPEKYRGQYADVDLATEAYLVFPEGSCSNLPEAGTDCPDCDPSP